MAPQLRLHLVRGERGGDRADAAVDVHAHGAGGDHGLGVAGVHGHDAADGQAVAGVDVGHAGHADDAGQAGGIAQLLQGLRLNGIQDGAGRRRR